MSTTVMSAGICAKIDRYFIERPQLKKPKSDIMGFELDSKILPFIESLFTEITQLKQQKADYKSRCEKLVKIAESLGYRGEI